MLRTLAKPSLNIDLALRIPPECLVPRDALNHRYLDKRALYAGHLAKAALDKERGEVGKLVDKVEVSCVRLSSVKLCGVVDKFMLVWCPVGIQLLEATFCLTT